MGIALAYGTELERAAVAARLDDELRFLLTAHTPVQRAIGTMLSSLLQDSGLLDLGYALRKDYVREHLGIGIREAQELAWLETQVVRYPETDRLWRAGRISRCHVRAILRGAAPEEDFLWGRLATIMSVRSLERMLDGQPDEEEVTRLLTFELSPELQVTWDVAFEVSCRLWERDISETEFLETLAAEFQSGASDDLFAATLEDDMPDPTALRAELQRLVTEAEEKAERETRRVGPSLLEPGPAGLCARLHLSEGCHGFRHGPGRTSGPALSTEPGRRAPPQAMGGRAHGNPCPAAVCHLSTVPGGASRVQSTAGVSPSAVAPSSAGPAGSRRSARPGASLPGPGGPGRPGRDPAHLRGLDCLC
ncbi:MAG TPA: hypothetical protein VGO93_28725, partial [Candidatus Xenobia bacterium]